MFAVLNVLTAHFCNTAIETASADQDVAVVRHLHDARMFFRRAVFIVSLCNFPA